MIGAVFARRKWHPASIRVSSMIKSKGAIYQDATLSFALLSLENLIAEIRLGGRNAGAGRKPSLGRMQRGWLVCSVSHRTILRIGGRVNLQLVLRLCRSTLCRRSLWCRWLLGRTASW